ncbi:MAG: PQQ-binding-like beta-propeller repeat protein, partial [Planctomycetota bacterium]|nr:PQQ-binding-like beta-propeller repeat protein [Planctomycetota bacterium]
MRCRMINVWYVVLLSLAGAALLPAPRRSLSAAEESFVGRWVLDARHIEGRRVLDTSGRRPGSVLGPVRHGKAPAALVFDGKENRVVLAEDIGGLALPRRAITLEAWALVEETRDWTGLVGALQDNKGHEKGWLLGCRDDRFVFGLSTTGADDGDGKLTYIVSRTRLEPGYWYHVVGTYDGEVQALHVDGRLEASSRTQRGDILYPDEAPLVIGAYHDRDELHPFHGRIAEVAIDDRAHRASEIERRFRSRKSSFPEIDPVPPRPGWPTYRHDSRRTGYTPEELQLPLHLQWTHRARHAPRPAWPPPARRDIWHRKPRLKARVVFDRTFHVVCDAGRVTFGSSADGEVHCLDGRSGRELWSFSTEGPVRLAPTIADGKVLAGSDDGFLYALDAASGRLLWKHRPGPGPERLPGNGRLISLWPLRSSAVVSAGVVHICAGLFPEQGTYRSSLDLASGELLERQEIGVSPQGYLVRRGGRLYAPSGRAPEAFVTQMRRTGKASEEALGTLASGYPHELIGAGGLRFAGGDGQVAAFRASDAHLVWRGEVEGKAYSLAVADGRLLVSTDAGVIHCFAREEVEAPSTIDHRRPGDDAQVETDERSEKFFASAAERILQASGVTRGYCLVLGSGEGRLAREIARRSELQVVGVESDPAKVARSRRLLADAGLLERVAVHERSPGKTFYPDYIANLIVSETLLVSGRFPCPVNEVHRLLRPGGGIACLGHPEAVPAEAGGGEGRLARRDVERWLGERRGDARIETAGGLWTLLTRRPLDGVGEWTHLYADPGNTASSGDERVGGRLRLQWFGPPGPRQLVDRHHRTVAPLVKDGRLFVPGDERLIAVDAYNGALLWNVEVPGFRRLGAGRDCGNLALADDVLYAATGASCRALDVRTGRLAGSFELPAPPGVPAERSYDWGYLARLGDVLLGSGVRRGASRSRLSRETIGEVYYDARPLV